MGRMSDYSACQDHGVAFDRAVAPDVDSFGNTNPWTDRTGFTEDRPIGNRRGWIDRRWPIWNEEVIGDPGEFQSGVLHSNK